MTEAERRIILDPLKCGAHLCGMVGDAQSIIP